MWGQLVVDIVVPALKGGLMVNSAADGPTIGDDEWTKRWE